MFLSMLRNCFLVAFIFCCFDTITMAGSIKGQLNLSEEWASKVYISEINSFDNLHTASYDFLRYEVDVDSLGYFEISDLQLVDEDRLYRLHICKKGDPISTIMIGGQEENFIHFIMNKKSEILISQKIESKGLQYCSIQGHPFGKELFELFNLDKKLNTPLDLPSAQNRAFIKKEILSDLTAYADSSSNEIVRLLAVHFINESFANINHLGLMEKVQDDFKNLNASSPYYDAFVERLSFLHYQNKKQINSAELWPNWLTYFLFIPVVLLLLWWRLKKKSPKVIETPIQKKPSLSTQEKRVLSLLKKGKSNKEISSELHIEVSTVKSHLNKIYSRLGVKSRKEIVDTEL